MAHTHRFHPLSAETNADSPYLLAGCRVCSETRRICARCELHPEERRTHRQHLQADDENQWAKAELMVRDADLAGR